MSTMENVTPLPSSLERVGRRIDNAWQRVCKGESEWVEGSLDLAQALAEGRKLFPADQAFGKWLKENKRDHVSHQDRAALLGLAGDMALARKELMKTTRRSYQHIWEEVKDRFTHVSNPTKPRRGRPPKGDKPKKGKRGKGASPKLDKAREIVRAKLDADEPISPHKLEKEHGISHVTFDMAITAEVAAREAHNNPIVTPDMLSMTAKKKLATAMRQQQRRLDAEHAKRMRDIDEEVRKRIVLEGKEYRDRLNAMEEKAHKTVKLYEQFINNHKPLYTIDHFNLLRKCLHQRGIAASDQDFDRAFNLIQTRKFQLTGEK